MWRASENPRIAGPPHPDWSVPSSASSLVKKRNSELETIRARESCEIARRKQKNFERATKHHGQNAEPPWAEFENVLQFKAPKPII